MNNAVQFNPNQPFEVVGGLQSQAQVPQFNPNQPFEIISQQKQQSQDSAFQAIGRSMDDTDYEGIGLRDVARTGARAAETFLGSHGNLASLGTGLVSGLTNLATGGNIQIPSYEEIQEKAPVLKYVAPTSGQLREGTKKLTGEYLEPQSRGEKVFDNFVEDLVSFTTPFGLLDKVGKGAKIGGAALKKAAKIGAGRALVGEAVHAVGGDEAAEDIAKSALTFGAVVKDFYSSIPKMYKEGYDLSRKALPEMKSSVIPELKMEIAAAEKEAAKSAAKAGRAKGSSRAFDTTYETAKEAANKVEFLKERLDIAVPESGRASTKPLKSAMESVEDYIKSGDSSAPGKKFLAQKIDQIKKWMFGKGGNQIPADQAWTLKKDFNEQFSKKFVDGSTLSNTDKKYLGELINGLGNTLKEYGSTVNPEFGKAWIPAEDMYKGYHQANKVVEFFKENPKIQSIVKSKAAKALFGAVFFGGGKAGKILTTAVPGAIAGAGYVAGEVEKAIKMIQKSPAIKKYYQEVLNDIALGNTAATAKSLSKLNKAAADYEKKNKD